MHSNKKYICITIVFFALLFSGCKKQNLNNEIKIGILAPLTGNMAQYGTSIVDGIKLCIDNYNKAADKDKPLISYIEYDEEGDTSKALAGFNFLLDKGIVALIGDMPSAQTLAIVDEAYEKNIPMITPSATDSEITYNKKSKKAYNNIFRVCFLDSYQGEKMASYLGQRLGAKNVAIFFCTDNDHSVEAKNSFVTKAEELGIKISALEGFSADSRNFKGQLTNIISKKPDFLFVPYYYEVVSLIGTEAKNLGLNCPMVGTDGWDTITSIISDTKVFEGSFYPSAYSNDEENDAAVLFKTSFKEKYEKYPNLFSAEGYDAAMILLNAIEKSYFKNLLITSDEFKESIIEEMKKTNLECATGKIIFDEFNNPVKNVYINKIVDGKSVFYEKY